MVSAVHRIPEFVQVGSVGPEQVYTVYTVLEKKSGDRWRSAFRGHNTLLEQRQCAASGRALPGVLNGSKSGMDVTDLAACRTADCAVFLEQAKFRSLCTCHGSLATGLGLSMRPGAEEEKPSPGSSPGRRVLGL